MHDVEEMFSVRTVPWHGLGSVLNEHPKSVDEILTAAGLNWNVEQFPVTVELPNGKKLVAEDKTAIVRMSDDKLLSVMGSTYTPIQPRALVEFAFSLLDVTQDEFETTDGEPPILFESGMSLAGGRINTIMCRVPKDIRIGGADPVSLYLGFVTSHDGSQRFGVHATPVRWVCRNTMALGIKRAVQSWSCKHTAGATNSIDEARRTLKLTWDYADKFTAQMNSLLDQEYTRRDFEVMVKDLFPKPASDPAPFSREQYALMGLIESSPTIDDGIRWTRYGALNAITEHLSWGSRYNIGGAPVEEKRTLNVMFGKAKAQSDKALAYLTS